MSPPVRSSGRAPRSATRTPCTRTRRSAPAECNVAHRGAVDGTDARGALRAPGAAAAGARGRAVARLARSSDMEVAQRRPAPEPGEVERLRRAGARGGGGPDRAPARDDA